MRGQLSIFLSAIQKNYQLLQDKASTAQCAAVVKANAYGLGIEPVAKTLQEAGVKTYFVALLEEAVKLRGIVSDADIYILNGILPGEENDFITHNLMPVLNTPDQLALWGKEKPCGIHVDTGLNRLGFNLDEFEQLEERNIKLVMSHLACADQQYHPMNITQRERFFTAAKKFPDALKSLAASDGIFLGTDYHGDLVRPGAALYGLNATLYQTNPMHPVVQLSVPVLQTRIVAEEGTVGYAATEGVRKGQRIATVSLGYADGFFRSLSNQGVLFYQGKALPVLGRVSMDVITVDISALPENNLGIGDMLEVFGPNQSVDQLAFRAGTIGYELLTALGQRFNRVYTP